MKIAWTRLAADDLEHIDVYFSKDNPAATDRVIATLRQSVEKLTDFPSLGREGLVKGTRELVITTLPCVISYRVKAGTVQILAALHTARDRERALARLAESPDSAI